MAVIALKLGFSQRISLHVAIGHFVKRHRYVAEANSIALADFSQTKALGAR